MQLPILEVLNTQKVCLRSTVTQQDVLQKEFERFWPRNFKHKISKNDTSYDLMEQTQIVQESEKEHIYPIWYRVWSLVVPKETDNRSKQNNFPFFNCEAPISAEGHQENTQ